MTRQPVSIANEIVQSGGGRESLTALLDDMPPAELYALRKRWSLMGGRAASMNDEPTVLMAIFATWAVNYLLAVTKCACPFCRCGNPVAIEGKHCVMCICDHHGAPK